MLIECAEFSDLPDILELQKLCYQENAVRYSDYSIPPLTQTLAELQADFQQGVVLKMVDGPRIIGSLRAFEQNGTAYIGRVIVHPEFQNRGLGKQMMLDLETRFPSTKRFELFTGFKDEKNLHFYASLGYSRFKDETHGTMTFVFLEKIKP